MSLLERHGCEKHSTPALRVYSTGSARETVAAWWVWRCRMDMVHQGDDGLGCLLYLPTMSLSSG
ncbi:hypothetical protein BN873_210059 [Candidatus Competibacter denitrificans Run_A_D11]|uniref:Uncharacterized protein n=1 Tax=Candidatus Competibacter denitrificans Run_A_D11 TaxID=1400863 RepID=W6MCA8_9GAMM|nr:hypothetical protein BN873_210059 [Candidatus Competibacter denitrificans Run_A_D11]